MLAGKHDKNVRSRDEGLYLGCRKDSKHGSEIGHYVICMIGNAALIYHLISAYATP
jgi:hypothetical protein